MGCLASSGVNELQVGEVGEVGFVIAVPPSVLSLFICYDFIDKRLLFQIGHSGFSPALESPKATHTSTLATRRRQLQPDKTPFEMASTAHRRLLQEYRALTNNPPDGITAGPVSEDDLLHWEALIQGPEGTPFEGGVFPAELKFPKDYPLAPPSMKFLGEIFHPNGKNRTSAPRLRLGDTGEQNGMGLT